MRLLVPLLSLATSSSGGSGGGGNPTRTPTSPTSAIPRAAGLDPTGQSGRAHPHRAAGRHQLGAVSTETTQPAWRYTGDARFPALYFGGNATGLDSEPQLRAESNYSLVILGGVPIGEAGLPDRVWQEQERVVGAQVRALRRSLEAQRRPAPPICTYLQGTLVLPWFTAQRRVLEDPALGGFIARHPNGSEIIPPLDPSLPPSVRGRDRYWDWSNGSAVRDYFVEQVVMPALGAVDCLFFDDVADGPPWTAEPAAFAAARLSVWQAVGRAMQQYEPRRPYPILSLAVATVADEDRWREAMAPGGFLKFYEFFCEHSFSSSLNLTWPESCRAAGYEADWTIPACGPTAAACVANCVTALEQAIADAERGIPTVLHGASNAALNNNSVAFSLAAFLIARGEDYSYYGSSGGPTGGWDDAAWSWHSEYDEDYGAPCGAPQRLDATTWSRNFSRCTVWVNVSAQQARITLSDRASCSASASARAPIEQQRPATTLPLEADDGDDRDRGRLRKENAALRQSRPLKLDDNPRVRGTDGEHSAAITVVHPRGLPASIPAQRRTLGLRGDYKVRRAAFLAFWPLRTCLFTAVDNGTGNRRAASGASLCVCSLQPPGRVQHLPGLS